MSLKIGINGFGRIGRNVFKIIVERDDMEVVSINDITDAKTLAHLLKYDSVHGRFKGEVEAGPNSIIVNGKEINITSVKNPLELGWGKLGVDIVVESTGVFTKKEQIAQHITAGAKKVVLTVPPKDEIDNMIVLGVNDNALRRTDNIISNASCTTNCLAPMVKVLHRLLGLKEGLMTTVHAYTNDQRTLDMPHKDLRRSRAASESIIPTSTGAARAVGKIIPELNGKLNGMAMRVPVKDGSVVDLVAMVEKEASIDAINEAMREASESDLKGILEYTEDPIVSIDVVGNPHSCVFDAQSTMIMGKHMVKVIGWYDNEWGYSNRVVELMDLIASKVLVHN